MFAPFVLDLRAGRLTCGEKPIRLRPKTWDVLLYLAERPGVLVTKNELLTHIWPSVVISEETLTKSIGEIRAALGDDLRSPRFVETVHGRGFRFVAPVTRRPRESASVSTPQPESTEAESIFVGRAAEREHLEGCWRRARAGRREIVFVSGEAGVGKTALVETFLTRLAAARDNETVLVTTGCSVAQKGPREAYLPVLAALERLGRAPHAEPLILLLRRFAPTWLAQMPWLVSEDARELVVDVRAERMLREFCTFVEALTETRPLVMVLEDLHWSDPATIELLCMLAQRREPARLLVIGTFRPAELAVQEHSLSHVKPLLRQRRQCSEIVVRDLKRAEVNAYIAERFPGCRQEAELAQVIYAHTDGNPLFMIAVLDDMVTRGWLLETVPGWSLSVPVAKADLGVPEDLRAVIAARLHSLPPADQQVLESASVVGVEFAAAAMTGCADMAAAEIEAVCERLVRSHRFLRAGGNVEWADGNAVSRYAFLHALYRQVVYEGISEGRRRQLHQRVGESIEGAYGVHADEVAAELALHFEQSRDPARAVKYLSLAARRVARRFAAREAVAYLERAIEIAERLPDAPGHRRQLLDLRFLLSSMLGQLHGYASDKARLSYEGARCLCEEVGTPRELYTALYALWPSQASRAEPATAETARRMVELAQTIGDPKLRAQAQVILGRTLFWQGKLTEARDVLQPVLGFWHGPSEDVDGFALLEPPEIAVHFYSAVVSALLGYPDRARASVSEGLTASEQVSHPFVLAGSLLHAAYIHHLYADEAEVEAFAQRSIVLADEHDFPFWKAMAIALSGWVLSRRGQADQGAKLIREGLDLHRASGAQTICSHMLAFLADACLRLGDIATGLDAVDEGLALCASTLDRVYEPELWRLKGELSWSAERGMGIGEPSPVRGRRRRDKSSPQRTPRFEEYFQRALALARDRSARLFELRAANSLARLWNQQGRGQEATGLLQTTCDRFTEGFDTHDMQVAKNLIGGR